ncbi:hypothetical protein LTR50_006504 [Elasticomyces elasticus]|nr:hypothetical protein LTR50_006504 [Elasticomyces elasticus]
MSAPPVDYYAALEIDPKATQQQIRDAYKKQALRHHPDRVPVDSPERTARTKKFQRINDAYYTLSDPSRRSDYDSVRSFHGFSSSSSSSSKPGSYPDSDPEEEIPRQQRHQDTSSGGGGFGSSFPWSAFGFGGQAQTESDANKFSSEQFGGVFEEMLREEGMAEGEQAHPTSKFWSLVGGLSGGAMGFIIANFPGAIAGAVGTQTLLF